VHVCIVGAGALGSVYGARLARFAGCEISVVARSAAPSPGLAGSAPATRERLERVEDGEVLPPVQGNAIQIEQVLVNLMLNGVQAVATDDCARREVVVAATRSGNTIEVAVSDSGRGIAADMTDRLFSPFATTKARGLGLGLAISRTIVENHGGRLWATNLKAGATFRFSLPLAVASSRRLPPAIGHG